MKHLIFMPIALARSPPIHEWRWDMTTCPKTFSPGSIPTKKDCYEKNSKKMVKPELCSTRPRMRVPICPTAPLPPHTGFCRFIPKELEGLLDEDFKGDKKKKLRPKIGEYLYADGKLDVSQCKRSTGRELSVDLVAHRATLANSQDLTVHKHLEQYFCEDLPCPLFSVKIDGPKTYPCSSVFSNAKGFFKVSPKNLTVKSECQALSKKELRSQRKRGPHLDLRHDSWVFSVPQFNARYHVRAVKVDIHWCMQVRVTLEQGGFATFEAGWNTYEKQENVLDTLIAMSTQEGRMGVVDPDDGTWHLFGDSTYDQKAVFFDRNYKLKLNDHFETSHGTSKWKRITKPQITSFLKDYSDMRPTLKGMHFMAVTYRLSCVSWLKFVLADYFQLRLFPESTCATNKCSLVERFKNLMERCPEGEICLPDHECMDGQMRTFHHSYKYLIELFGLDQFPRLAKKIINSVGRLFDLPTECIAFEDVKKNPTGECTCKRDQYVEKYDVDLAYFPSFVACKDHKLIKFTHLKKREAAAIATTETNGNYKEVPGGEGYCDPDTTTPPPRMRRRSDHAVEPYQE